MERLSIQIINSNRLDRQIFNFKINEYFIKTIKLNDYIPNRLAKVEKNVFPIIQVYNEEHSFSPLFYVPYGSGYFLINLDALDKNHSYKQNIKNIINSLYILSNNHLLQG